MTLEGIEKNFNKIKELNRQHNKLQKEKEELENKTNNLKDKYSEGSLSRNSFSEPNQKLTAIKKSIEKIIKKVKILSGNIRKGIEEEIKNVQ